ncbi:MAG: DUF2017 family protein [Ilumatobacteraceae bacterium]
MARVPLPPVQRTATGFRMNLDTEERELIHRLLGELRSLLTESESVESGEPTVDGPVDDRMKRLFPTAYHQRRDQEMDDEFRRLMRDDLVASRLAGLDLLADVLAPHDDEPPHLTEAQLMAFLQAVNGVRLVLGTMLDVSEEHEIDDIDDDHPMVGEYHLYDFLSWVLDASVRAAMS